VAAAEAAVEEAVAEAVFLRVAEAEEWVAARWVAVASKRAEEEEGFLAAPVA
jgi:hypothetical protein